MATKSTKTTARTKTASKKNQRRTKMPVWLIVLIIIVAVVILILTPTQDPRMVVSQADTDYNVMLCLPANDGSYIYHPNYWLSYSEEHEQAQWVATVLLAANVLSPNVERSDNFIPDPDIPTKSALTSDYTGTGFDRGHILSFASNGWNQEAGDASFYMSNMSPQYPNTNRNTYERLEEAERSATVQNGVLYVVHGPVLTDGPYEKIGKSTQISVPKQYFVCFLDYTGDTTKAIGFLIPNDNVTYKDITRFAVTVDEVEALTGLDFWPGLPDEDEQRLESSIDVKAWDLSAFNRQKLASTYGYDLNNLEASSAVSISYKTPETLTEQLLYFLYRNFAQNKIDLMALLGL